MQQYLMWMTVYVGIYLLYWKGGNIACAPQIDSTICQFSNWDHRKLPPVLSKRDDETISKTEIEFAKLLQFFLVSRNLSNGLARSIALSQRPKIARRRSNVRRKLSINHWIKCYRSRCYSCRDEEVNGKWALGNLQICTAILKSREWIKMWRGPIKLF
jgi:hypothetical protein